MCDSLPSLSIYQPLNSVNHRTPHFSVLGGRRDIVPPDGSICRALLHANTHTERGGSHEASSRRMHLITLLPCAVNASYPFSPFSQFLLLLLFSFQIICSQRHGVALPTSPPFVGNWLQKWHLAFRSDRLWAICSVSGEGRLGLMEECDRPSVCANEESLFCQAGAIKEEGSHRRPVGLFPGQQWVLCGS